MKNRYRVEIFDEVKSNDLTIYSDEGVKEVKKQSRDIKDVAKIDPDLL